MIQQNKNSAPVRGNEYLGKKMFITFEGCEASGKSTQAIILRDYFLDQGQQVFFTKEPGGTPLAEKLRDILLGKEIVDVLTEFLLLSAARRDHILKIKKKLQDGFIVISDRFYDSSVAIQSFTKDLNHKFVVYVTDMILEGLQPDITFILDVETEKLWQRLQNKDRRVNFYDKKDLQFHKKVRDSFLKIAEQEPQRTIIINGNHDVYTISTQIKQHLLEKHLITTM